MQLNPDIRILNKFVLDVDIEQLVQLQNAIQLAKQRAVAGQELFVDIAPHVALRVTQSEQSRPVKFSGLPLEPPKHTV